MTKKIDEYKEEHNEHYHEEGRNGWTPTSTLGGSGGTCKETNPIKENDKEEIKGYVKQLEMYVSDMENYLISSEMPSEDERDLNGMLDSAFTSSATPEVFSDSLDSLSLKITNLLKQKNKAYGNTALNPPRIFSKLASTEGICARIDDKLSRIQNKGINDTTEDTVDDLIGYLFLLKMSMK